MTRLLQAGLLVRSAAVSGRRYCPQGQGVDAAGDLVRERLVDEALAGDPVHPGEGIGNDRHVEMGLAARLRPGVTGVALRIVDDVETYRLEALGQFAAHRVGDAHRLPAC